MSSVRALLKYIFGRQSAEGNLEDPLDYEQVVHLDAEDLAEQGIQSAYAALLPQLLRYTTAPLEITQEVDTDAGAYAVCAGGSRYEIWASAIDPNDGWARATAAFFTIVNASLVKSEHKFYALYGGNDLSGLFLTADECLLARRAIKRRSYWPYIPVMEAPHYGFPGASAA
jgi:hypothetical protein